MRTDAPEPNDWIETEITRLTIVTGTSSRPRPQRRHPLLLLFNKGHIALSTIAAIITVSTTLTFAFCG